MEKIKRLWSFIVFHTLYIQDEPDSQYNRQWRRWIDSYKKDTFVAISFETQLTQFNGLPTEPRPVVMHQIGLELNPKKWKINQDHTYYDGNHCSYNFGPLSFYTSGTKDCRRCRDDG